MKGLTGERREELAQLLNGTWYKNGINPFYKQSEAHQEDWRKVAEAAYAYLAPVLYGEALRPLTDGEIADAARGTSTDYGKCAALFANRLRSLTAPPVDPRVETVSKLLRDPEVGRGQTFDEAAKTIIAALDKLAADKAPGDAHE